MFTCENCDWKGTDPEGFRQSFNDWAGYQDECNVVILPAGSCPKCEAPVYRDEAHAAFTLAKAAPALLAALIGDDPDMPPIIRPIRWLETLLEDCRRRGAAPDDEDPSAYVTCLDEVQDLLDKATAAVVAAVGTPP